MRMRSPAAGIPGRVDEEGMWPDAIYELRPLPDTGGAEVVWEWHAWDHLVQDHDVTKANYGSVPDHPGQIDLNFDHRDQPAVTPEELEKLRELERQMAALGYGGHGRGRRGGRGALGQRARLAARERG